MDDDLKESSSIKDTQEESPTDVQTHPDFCAAPTPLSAIPISSPHYSNPLYINKQSGIIPTESPNAKRGRYGSPWRVVTHPSQPLLFPPSLSPSHFTLTAAHNNPSSSSPTGAQPSHSASSPSTSSKSQPFSQDPISTAQDNLNCLALRKGKFVSPVWKPHEMLWLARAWRIQYCGDPSKSESGLLDGGCLQGADTSAPAKNKTRADKDREVAEFLNKHGVNRDAKTAGTKWDNMLGEFRKVYEWEKELDESPVPPPSLRDRTDYFVECLRVPASRLPSLFELSSYVQEPPSKEMRFPVRHDVYEDLPTGKESFFSASSDTDCRAITYQIVGPLIRPSSRALSRESFIGLWDDCINKIINKFCTLEIMLIRKSGSEDSTISQEQWPNVCGFVKNLCLWRGEETDAIKEGADPSISIVDKLLWTYGDLPYILGYYAVANSVTLCALSKSHERVIRIDLASVDLSTPAERLKALVPCWRIARLLPLLADHGCSRLYKSIHSDYERLDRGNGKVIEVMLTQVKKVFPNRRKWASVKEIYDFLDNRVPHAEYIYKSAEKELALIFKPRGYASKPSTVEQLLDALKFVTKALVALHNLSFMHRDIRWDNVMKKIDTDEWFIIDFEDAIGAPQAFPHNLGGLSHAPEMSRGVHGVKVDVWSVGHLIKTCGLNVSELFKELQNRCLEHDPDQRPSAADCYPNGLSCVIGSVITRWQKPINTSPSHQ